MIFDRFKIGTNFYDKYWLSTDGCVSIIIIIDYIMVLIFN